MKTVGFIGTGIMGRWMIRNLMKAGFDVTVYTRTKAKAEELLTEGAKWADSVADCAKGKDAVITIVGYPQDVEQVYFGSQGILENAAPGAVVIDMTTSTPELARRIFDAAKAKGLDALDAPVTGGERGAKAGTMVIMVGGEMAAFERAMPLFEAMGQTIRNLGPAGSGQHCKMANQIGISGALAAVCEIVAYAKAVGLDPEAVLQTIGSGSAGSTQMEMVGPKIVAGDDNPSFYLKHLLKDLGIAVGESKSRGRSLPVVEMVHQAYQTLADQGHGESGHQALMRFYD